MLTDTAAPPLTPSPAQALRTLQVAILGGGSAERAAMAQALADLLATHTETHVQVALQTRSALQEWALRAADGQDVLPTASGPAAMGDRAAAVPIAATHKATFALTLLQGRDSAVPTPADEALRSALMAAGAPFQVLYGTPAVRALQALNAIAALTGQRRTPAPAGAPDRPQRLRAWGCEKCSDPECEHALFQRLLQSR